MDSLPILGIGASAAGSSGIRNPQAVAYLLPGAYVAPNAKLRVNGAPGNTASYRVEGQDASNGQVPAAPAAAQRRRHSGSDGPDQQLRGRVRTGRRRLLQLHDEVRHQPAPRQLYDYFVNEVFNAATPWVNAKAGGAPHDYGFTVGGPIVIPQLYNGHDKTFFFFNWEQFRETQNINNQTITIPTDAYRAGNFGTALTDRNLGTDPLGRPIPEGAVYDPNTTRLSRTAASFAISSPETSFRSREWILCR